MKNIHQEKIKEFIENKDDFLIGWALPGIPPKLESWLSTTFQEIEQARDEEILKAVESKRDHLCDKISQRGKTPFRNGKKSAFTQVVQIIESLTNKTNTN